MDFFERSKCLLGEEALRKVSSLRLGVVGSGVLGHLLSVALSRLGVEELRVLDCDVVKEKNLANSFLFSKYHLGRNKAEVTAELSAIWSLNGVSVSSYSFDVTDTRNLRQFLAFVDGLDLVYGCLDNIPARFATSTAALIRNVRYVDLGIDGFAGRIRFVDRERACYSCNPLIEDEKIEAIFKLSEEADCDYAPTVTILPICLATVSHAIVESLKYLGIFEEPDYDYVYFHFLSVSKPIRMKISKREDCVICGKDGMVSWDEKDYLG